MQTIYKTIDGKMFEDKHEAYEHETKICNGVVMLNRNNQQVFQTSHAFLVWLKDENANLAFHEMARSEGDDAVKSIVEGEDYGLFYWDEVLEEYRWIDSEMAESLIKMKELIEEKDGCL